ncbi:hypothetical protein Pint_30616 [Pistacia integerrima]|uniref:Uncharacterized protein n=1 Tax=Pistacia integerrima TaxID=434235 RepID=A0ACC0WZU9_9ROSI|nr:hypothetical protein Pint_30616 [Pistacia integerrima]
MSLHGFKVTLVDFVELVGILLPYPYFGFTALRASLVVDTYLEVASVTHFKKNMMSKPSPILSYRMSSEEMKKNT